MCVRRCVANISLRPFNKIVVSRLILHT